MKSILHRVFGRAPDIEHHPVRTEVLVVEDNKDELDFLTGLLRQQNCVTTTASSIAGALVHLNSMFPYQLAFVDLGLPDGSGVEVVRRIKEHRRMCHTIVVSGSPEQILMALNYGYIGLLSKPYTVNSIGEILWKSRLPCAF